jgi:HK97 family phage prohead protease
VILNRAYSVLEVKDISDDGEFYTITGMATTPKPDRVNDVVNPLGATFAPEIPLLWQHMHDKPVGITTLGKPTKKGIPFKARLPIIKEEGALKTRIDEAIQSIKYRLVAAVSIGFRVLNDAVERIADGGYQYNETEILELSLATIPAQIDATILSVKSLYEAPQPAASGQTPRSFVKLISPGVSGTTPVAIRGPVKLIPRKYREEDTGRSGQGPGEHSRRETGASQ